jgi:hypothetical protein
VLTTVDSSDDHSARMEVPAVQLTRVSKLEKALTNLKGSTVNLIKEQKNGTLTSGSKPVGSVPSGDLTNTTINSHLIRIRKAEKITLSHLRSTTLDNLKAEIISSLVSNLRLADTVATAYHDGEASLENVGHDTVESLEVNSHRKNPCQEFVTGGQLPPISK